MGYRSEVGLLLNKDAVEKLQDKLQETHDVIRQKVFALLGEYADEHYVYDNATELWIWTNIKWYNDFDDVGFIEKFLRTLHTDDYYFIRIGEALDDTETEGDYWDGDIEMAVSRKITFIKPLGAEESNDK